MQNLTQTKVHPNSKEFALKTPTGEIVTGKNISEFCRNNNLHLGAICGVLNGSLHQHKGWRLPNSKLCGTINSRSKEFTLKSPDGEIITSRNITEFARQNNLQVGNLHRVISGKLKSHKGWSLPETEKIDHEARLDAISKEFKLKSPSGEILIGKNIKKFCEENNLTVGCVYGLLLGKQNNHKGWTLEEVEYIPRDQRKAREFTIKSPDGEIVTGKNIKKFCLENSLHSGAITNVLNGKASHHKGWTLP